MYPRKLVAVLTLAIATVGCAAFAANRTPRDVRKVLGKQTIPESQVIALSERPLALGYEVGDGERWVKVGNEAVGHIGYRIAPFSDANLVVAIEGAEDTIKPENFVRMWGTREGVAELARAMGRVALKQPLKTSSINPLADPVPARIEGVALFEKGGVIHMLFVRFEGEDAIFEDIVIVAAGCSAEVPNHPGCGCTASGDGASCGQGTIPSTGVNWAKCKDGNLPSPEVTDCQGSGGTCQCSIAAQ